MCICRQADVRSDYAMLKIPGAIQEYSERNNDTNNVESREGIYGERRSPIHSSKDCSSLDSKLSKCELVVRFIFIAVFLCASFTLYQQEQQIAAQRSKLLETKIRNEDTRRKIRELRSFDQYSLHKDIGVDGSTEHYARVQVDFESTLEQI